MVLLLIDIGKTEKELYLKAKMMSLVLNKPNLR